MEANASPRSRPGGGERAGSNRARAGLHIFEFAHCRAVIRSHARILLCVRGAEPKIARSGVRGGTAETAALPRLAPRVSTRRRDERCTCVERFKS